MGLRTQTLLTLLVATLLLLPSTRAQVPERLHDVEGFEKLIAAFSELEGLQANFVEEKQLRLLRAPLVSKGELYFLPAHYLLRKIQSPQPSTVLITPSSLSIQTGTDREVIDFEERPEVRAFVDSFVAILAGDIKSLTTNYDAQFQRTADGMWTLLLKPKIDPLTQLIESVQIQGSNRVVSKIVIVDKTGDTTTTTITNARPNRKFTPSEKRSLFGIGSP